MRVILFFKLPFIFFAIILLLCLAAEQWTVQGLSSEAFAAGKISVSKKDKSPVRIAIYSGEGAYFRSIKAATKMFEWMGADAQRITPEEIIAGKLDDFDILYMTGVHTEFEEGDERDNVRWDNDMHDPESEWPLMFNVVRWLVRQDDSP